MLIKDWMSSEVTTVTKDTSMLKASKIFKDNNFRRLPVVDDSGKLVGIVTDRDIKDASPSKATTLDVHELYYLLSEIKIKDIMTPSPFTINVGDSLEKAAIRMLEKKVEGLPVVDEKGEVVGIITETDIFKALVNITGAYQGGLKIGIKLSSQPGTLKPLLDVLRSHNARVISILTSHDQADQGFRHVYMRIHDMDRSEENALKSQIELKFDTLFWLRDNPQ
ncbi:CBS and ACT domain-containing protein [Desulfonatronovibrio magnus]|uniref:CBS and ACT domain-containing protein n=1 Tax=Desulfonatronovibrio magnus TaxID=698827 RepID=UPI0005EBD372|nr:CBS and ACT domain-containing protein [Desulfonatronovibrio magnus]RQD66747.1 MAG: CBS domain-containing protein [Desulfonatronovibrio sp. MSAO_Bac4]